MLKIKNIICIVLSVISSIITHMLIAPFLSDEGAIVLLFAYFCTYMGIFISLANIILKYRVKYFVYCFSYCTTMCITLISFMLALSENALHHIKVASCWTFAISFIAFCIFTAAGIKMEQKEKYNND